MNDSNSPRPPAVPRWAVATIVMLTAALVAVVAAMLAHADDASIAGAIRTGGATFAATIGILLALAAFLGGR